MKGIKKNQVIITGLAIMIAIAGYINYTGSLSNLISITKNEENNVVNKDNNGDIIGNDVYPEDDITVNNPGAVILTSGNVSNARISQAKLNREQVRAKNQESLLAIINDNTVDSNAKTSAVKTMAELSSAADKETAIELLLEAKGFKDVVASITNETVDIVINADSITETQKVQIEDIAKRKSGLPASSITINVCNNLTN